MSLSVMNVQQRAFEGWVASRGCGRGVGRALYYSLVPKGLLSFVSHRSCHVAFTRDRSRCTGRWNGPHTGSVP